MGYSIGLIIVMMVLFYFMLIRPENKKKKAAEELRNSLKIGDDVTTIGGIVGRIVMVQPETIVVETSEDRVRMELAKWAVSQVGIQTSQNAADNAGGSPDEEKN